MPSKTLIYSAEVLHLARHGKLFGLQIDGARADIRWHSDDPCPEVPSLAETLRVIDEDR